MSISNYLGYAMVQCGMKACFIYWCCISVPFYNSHIDGWTRAVETDVVVCSKPLVITDSK